MILINILLLDFTPLSLIPSFFVFLFFGIMDCDICSLVCQFLFIMSTISYAINYISLSHKSYTLTEIQ